jgi:hypothetical protein
MYCDRKLGQAPILQHAEMIYHVLLNPAVGPIACFKKLQETRIINYKAHP